MNHVLTVLYEERLRLKKMLKDIEDDRADRHSPLLMQAVQDTKQSIVDVEVALSFLEEEYLTETEEDKEARWRYAECKEQNKW